MAERVGFEPTVAFRPLRFSSPTKRRHPEALSKQLRIFLTHSRRQSTAITRTSRHASPPSTHQPLEEKPLWQAALMAVGTFMGTLCIFTTRVCTPSSLRL